MKRTLQKGSMIALVLMLAMLSFSPASVYAAGELDLYTSYASVTVSPGDNVRYSIEVSNPTSAVQTNRLSVSGLPEDWSYTLQASSYNIERISVKPNDSQTVNLNVQVPYLVDKGTYNFSVDADGISKLPLSITVAEQGVHSSELTVDQPNMQGHSDSNFNFSAEINNQTSETQNYALQAAVDPGWVVEFRTGGDRVTAVQVEPHSSETIAINVTPPNNIEAGTYTIPIRAVNNATSAEAELEVDITGTYKLELGTVQGPLSTKITAGGERVIDLKITNTGTADIQDIDISSINPSNWEVTFEPANIDHLAAGESANVQATLKADKASIAGDYVINISADAAEASSDAVFRVTVETSMLWGWIGVLIIAAVIGGIYFLIRKYGRR